MSAQTAQGTALRDDRNPRLSSLIGPRISELCLLSMGEPVLYPFTPVVGRDVGFGVGTPISW